MTDAHRKKGNGLLCNNYITKLLENLFSIKTGVCISHKILQRFSSYDQRQRKDPRIYKLCLDYYSGEEKG